MSRQNATERKRLARPPSREYKHGAKYTHKAIKGSIEPVEAYKQLSKLTADQKVVAGHLALEIAREYSPAHTDETAQWLEAAVDSFKRAAIESRLGGVAYLLTLSEAELGMIHARAIEPLLVSEKLPNLKVAQATHKLYLQQARRLAQTRQLMLETKQYGFAQDALGKMGELAVLALCQRFAIREVGPESWFPYHASLFEDNANIANNAKYNHAWDISIYTDVEQGDPQLDYRLQVKSTLNARENRPDAPGISRVHIKPDLLTDIDKTAPDTIVHILGQCEAELTSRNPNIVVSARLDSQTERLLDIIDLNSEPRA